MKRWALVTTDHRTRRRWPLAVLALAGMLGVGCVLAIDPVGYGVPVWPFADRADQAEQRLMSEVASAAKAGTEPHNAAIEVVARTVRGRNELMTLRLHLEAEETRCREVIVRGDAGLDVGSRRTDC